MKALVQTLIGVGAFACSACTVESPKSPLPPLAAPEIVELLFTADGKSLVVVCNNPSVGPRSSQYSRIKRYTTADWKLAADTGELSIHELFVARSATATWIVMGCWFDRRSSENVPPVTARGAAFSALNPMSLEMKEINVERRDKDAQSSLDVHFYQALALNSTGSLAAVQICKYGGPLLPAHIIDAKSGAKKFQLEDFPTAKKPLKADDYGHSMTLLEFTPDDEHVVSFFPYDQYGPGELQMYDSKTGKRVRTLKTEAESSVGSMKFSPDGKLLACLCWKGEVLIVASDLTKTVHKLQVAGDDWPLFQHAIAFVGNDRLAVVSGRRKIELFDTRTWKKVHSFEMDGNRANCVAGSPDGKLLAAGYGDTARTPGVVRVWDIGTSKLVVELK